MKMPASLHIQRPGLPHIPQLLATGLAVLVLGVVLDALWPQQLWTMTVRWGLGPVLSLIGLVLTVAVLGPALLRREARRTRVAFRDATERAERWEDRARAQEVAHARFMRELDHELKNPLQAIKTAFADLEQTDGLSESIETARGQVERLRTLSGRLRQLASVTSDRLAREPVDLDELVRDAVELARAAVPGSEDRVHLVVQQIPWRLSPVQADRELLSHAIYNLLDNALKYSPTERLVEVRLREDGTTATIEVADAGCGIDPLDLPHVAEELYRGDRTQGVEGSGLGLALVNRVAAAHGGQLEVRSRPGEGTVAAMRLPLVGV
jgi:two-component system, OmpR family, sensor kinase